MDTEGAMDDTGMSQNTFRVVFLKFLCGISLVTALLGTTHGYGQIVPASRTLSQHCHRQSFSRS